MTRVLDDHSGPKLEWTPYRIARTAVIVAFWVAVVWGAYRATVCVLPSRPNLERIEALTGISFPPSARLLGSYRSTPLVVDFYGKVGIDQSDVEAFIAGVRPRSVITRKERIDGAQAYEKRSSAPDWWRPGSPRRFVSLQTMSPAAICTYILVSLDDPKRAVIYLHYER